ncbi:MULTISPECIES: hypothetical protein [Myxococcus]|nr:MULTISPECIES: hypothetical protein [Myxococcus]NOJ55353.1 hypothetical protein [Myxococcus xanthus]QPM77981.1 hypothetical protein I5Q59_27405 [Myxococcus xanthus]QVW67049.1 hypothetical protein JTM82_32755 [Myxococcus xanthus DZ2]QZZ53192.1 hypothetical protein MyxoNM_28655 [Myxococcus xanthus]UEO06825.1 hypothetical protein K1515_10040 [Myxococcus xanthus DZ2]
MPAHPEPHHGEPTSLRASDGFSLGASRFAATAPLVDASSSRARPARRGFETLTFDYRGIGRPSSSPTRAAAMRWGAYNMLDLNNVRPVDAPRRRRPEAS